MSGPEDENKPAPSGRVRHDSGGRAIWEWAVDSGRHAIDSTSRLLKKLDISSLRLLGDDEKAWEKKPGKSAPAADAESARTPVPSTLRLEEDAGEQKPAVGQHGAAAPLKPQGFDPYDSRTPVRKVAPAKRAPRPPPPRKGFLSRLFGRG